MWILLLALSSSKNSYEELKFTVVEGIRVKVDSGPSLHVFRNQKEFLNFLEKHNLFPSRQKLPRIDFQKYILIGVFSGRRPTGGYSIKVERVLRKNGELLIHAVEGCPEPGSMVVQVITYPSVFFTIEKFPLKEAILEFEQCYGKKQIKKIKSSADYQE